MNIIISGFQIHWVFPQWSRIVLQPDQKRFKVQLMLLHTLLSGRRGCLSVSALCSESNGPGLCPGWGHCIYHPIQGRVEILLPRSRFLLMGAQRKKAKPKGRKNCVSSFFFPWFLMLCTHLVYSKCNPSHLYLLQCIKIIRNCQVMHMSQTKIISIDRWEHLSYFRKYYEVSFESTYKYKPYVLGWQECVALDILMIVSEENRYVLGFYHMALFLYVCRLLLFSACW